MHDRRSGCLYCDIRVIERFLTFVPPLAGWAGARFPELLVLRNDRKLWPPRYPSGRRGLGQALKPKLVRSERPPTGSWDHFFLATE